MCFSVTPLIETLPRLSNSISNCINNGPLILSKLPFVGPICARNFPKLPLQFGEATHIIIVCISDPNGVFPKIYGPEGDFKLLLKHLRYCHDVDPRDIIIIHDFDIMITDANQVPKLLSRTSSTRDDIRLAIQETMQDVGPGSKVFFYFGGHGEMVPLGAPVRENADGQVGIADEPISRQYIIAGDGQRISGAELRSWFGSIRHPSVAVTAVFDSCNSGGLLGLPYTYDLIDERVRLRESSRQEVPLPMLQISACQATQSAYSKRYSNGELHGRLTWNLTRYLQENEDHSIEGLVEYLYTYGAVDQEDEHQTPQVCCSRKLTGRITLL